MSDQFIQIQKAFINILEGFLFMTHMFHYSEEVYYVGAKKKVAEVNSEGWRRVARSQAFRLSPSIPP